MKIKLQKINTFSNYISFFRVLLAIPIFVFVSNINEIDGARYYLVSLYFFAFLTDIADGYFARKFNEVSELGKIIDPLADKILVFLVAAYLFYFEIIPAFYFYIVIIRDIVIFIGGFFVAKKIGKVLPSNYLGKFTVLVIGFFIITATLGVSTDNIFYIIFFYGSLVLCFASLISYGIRGYQEIKKG